MHGRLIASSALLAALVLSSCGGGGSDDGDDGNAGTSGTSPPAGADVTVRAVDGIKWDAEAYAATSTGGKVRLEAVNDSTLPHDLYVIAADGTQLPQSIVLQQRGDDKTETFDAAPGTYTIICKVAGHTNMKAELTVT